MSLGMSYFLMETVKIFLKKFWNFFENAFHESCRAVDLFLGII